MLPVEPIDRKAEPDPFNDERSQKLFSWPLNVFCQAPIIKFCSVLFVKRQITAEVVWGHFPSRAGQDHTVKSKETQQFPYE